MELELHRNNESIKPNYIQYMSMCTHSSMKMCNKSTKCRKRHSIRRIKMVMHRRYENVCVCVYFFHTFILFFAFIRSFAHSLLLVAYSLKINSENYQQNPRTRTYLVFSFTLLNSLCASKSMIFLAYDLAGISCSIRAKHI